MPLYEYQCTKCKHTFEKIQKFSDPPVTECPKCGGKVEQLLSAPAIQFKGAGWYVNDYAKKSGSPGSGKNGSSSEAKSESKNETKTESKPSSSDKK
ncbi:MAG TPA: zinc ribbon domain-containing protein [Terriglobales bacterium]|nr:zinc ribbon domain-containing protein [Terriglobales bacterium]